MRTVTAVLGAPGEGDVTVRPAGTGDLGWILTRHGNLFTAEFGWGPGFERLIARVLAEYSGVADEPGNAAWIAELGHEPAGSILCVRAGPQTAKLRLLLVEPFARGRGVGARLVGECIRFARDAGYGELVLWTMDVLVHARAIYERAGFELVDSAPHQMFGPEVTGQTWRLRL